MNNIKNAKRLDKLKEKCDVFNMMMICLILLKLIMLNIASIMYTFKLFHH